ncbi:MAG: hypothetical protein C0412_20065 [Flavobacterium sp.]|nr:hypothetical protein [Flavobacterium sp.]
MKKILLHAWLFLYAISHGVNAETLEEQANRIELANKEIELSKENDRKKIPNIFDNYKNSLQITTGQPKVIDSDGNKVKISMDVFVKLNDPDLSLQIGRTIKEFLYFPMLYKDEKGNTYYEISYASGGSSIAWDELIKRQLRAEITVLGDKSSIPLFGSFENGFTVKIVEKEVFEIVFSVEKKKLNLDLTPKIELVSSTCKEIIRGAYYGACKKY